MEQLIQQGQQATLNKDFDTLQLTALQIMRLEPFHLQAVLFMADVLVFKRKIQDALNLLFNAYRRNQEIDLIFRIAQCQFLLKNHKESAVAYRSYLQKRPKDMNAWLSYIDSLIATKQIQPAAEACNEAIKMNPETPLGYLKMGQLFRSVNFIDRAIEVLQYGVNNHPRDIELIANLGEAQKAKGHVASAEENLTKALAFDPDHQGSLYSLGQLHMESGHFLDAIGCFEKILDRNPGQIDTYQQLVTCRKDEKLNKPLIDQMENLLQKSNLADKDQGTLRFALGKVYDDAGLYQRASDHYRIANSIRTRFKSFDPLEFTTQSSKVIEVFSHDVIEQNAQSRIRGDNLIFVIGLPRSGSSLLDQILSSHSRVSSLGENSHISRLTIFASRESPGKEPFPQCLESLDPALFPQMAQQYLTMTGIGNDSTGFYLDKTLINYQHAGFIKLLFPKAQIVHIKRHKGSTCTSMYFSDFTAGHHYSFSGEGLICLVDNFERLMQHWKSVFGDQIIEVEYENIVHCFKKTVSSLCRDLGIDYEPGMEGFYENESRVNTASCWQVRQKIFGESVNRSENYHPYFGFLSNLSDH